ncbi:MAG: hypothetical protein QW134_09935 [Nitrososphaeria archaeon]
MRSTKGFGIPESVLIMVVISVIISVVVISYAYISVISKITSAGSDLQNMVIFGSILIPLTVLVFIDLIKTEQWKKIKSSKYISIFLGILLMFAFYFIFIGASLSLVSPLQSVSIMYAAVSLSVIVLAALVSIFIRMNLSEN